VNRRDQPRVVDVSHQLKKQLNTIMIKTEVKIDGITYTVRATTEAGIKSAIRAVKKAVKQIKKDEDNGDEA